MTAGESGFAGADALLVSGGGVTSVVSAELFQHRARLAHAADGLMVCANRLVAIDALVRPAGDQYGSLLDSAPSRRAEVAIDDAQWALRMSAGKCMVLAVSLQLAADGYSRTEDLLERSAQSVAAQIGHSLGFLTSTLSMILLPGLVAALTLGTGALALAAIMDPGGVLRAVRGARNWLDERKEILSDPRFVQLVRLGAMSADDFGLGLLHVPEPVRSMLGDEGGGLLGLDTSAGTGMLLGSSFGALRETRVSVTPVRSRATPSATGWADRAARIPTGAAQVRVDRYIIPGQRDRFEVYIGGTADASAFAQSEPWDMTSNVAGVAGLSAGAYRAVTTALAAAGATADSPLMVSGYSQGGLIGARLAASGDHNVRGLFTLGAPAGQVPVPARVSWVALEHTDDLVPAVGGIFASPTAVLARREVFRGVRPDDRLALPAHQLNRYRASAALADESGDRRLQSAAGELSAFTAGAERAESTWFHAQREGTKPRGTRR